MNPSSPGRIMEGWREGGGGDELPLGWRETGKGREREVGR